MKEVAPLKGSPTYVSEEEFKAKVSSGEYILIPEGISKRVHVLREKAEANALKEEEDYG